MQTLTRKLTTLTVLVLALLIASVPSLAQEKTMFVQFRNPADGSLLNVLHARIAFSRVTWYFDGTVATCEFKVQSSNNGSTWIDLFPAEDCSSPGRFQFIAPSLGKYIRFSVPTITGGGFVNILWEGFLGIKCGREYPGIFTVVVGDDPAVGDELAVVVPASERWRVYSAAFELDTNSTLADREVFLTASDGGNEYFRVFADGVVKASQKGIFTTAALGFVGTTGLGPSSIHQPADVRTVMIPIYSDAFIPGGHTLSTDTNGMQSGDDYGPAIVLVERCPN